ncbi:MAG: hypothetical protein ACOCRK_11440 [bacterium]
MIKNRDIIIVIIIISVLLFGFFYLKNSIFNSFNNIPSISTDYIIEQEQRDKVFELKIDSLNQDIKDLHKEVYKYQTLADDKAKEVDSLLAEIQPRPEDLPENIEECLDQLELVHQREDQLTEVIDIQSEEITTLRALNQSQGIIITNQAKINKIKDSQIEAWKEVAEDEKRKGNIKAILFGGIVFGVMSIL